MSVGLLLRYSGLTKGEAFGLILDFAGGSGCNVVVFIFPPTIYLLLYKQGVFNGSDQGDALLKYYSSIWPMLLFGMCLFVCVPLIFVLELMYF